MTLGNQVQFDSLVQVSLYSPCTVSIANNTGFAGQVIGSTISKAVRLQYVVSPVLIPGSNITSFKEDLAYIREVVNP